MASKTALVDSLAPILAIASGLTKHEGELGAENRRAIANEIIELTQQALLEIDASPEELALAFQRYDLRLGKVGRR
jgi:hypothetical protein